MNQERLMKGQTGKFHLPTNAELLEFQDNIMLPNKLKEIGNTLVPD